ncbi:MAG: ABC transporter ATP-binding protein [Puniceicoccaceae bacterium]|nr:MAG: ABC transporter ATP-binding protein [Puniceicoccaceae bacterium]
MPSTATTPDTETIIEVNDLSVTFRTEEGLLPAVDGVSFKIRRGQTLALVGESGCGKSVTAQAILRLIRPPGRIARGSMRFFPGDNTSPVDIAALADSDERLYTVRGDWISMIFQEPMTALSPVHTVGNQLCEAVLLHQSVTKKEAERLAIEMLGKVGLPGPEKRMRQYPFELSGGMRQRVVIAMALVCRPRLLIADEPTTALDVTIQAQILGLIRDLQQEMNTAVLFITHDLGVVAQMADEVAVMYLGRVIETGAVRGLLKNPLHPYTASLLRSLPSLHGGTSRLPAIPGSVPSLNAIPPGCPFHPRCPHFKTGVCDIGGRPDPVEFKPNRHVACVRLDDIHAPSS